MEVNAGSSPKLELHGLHVEEALEKLATNFASLSNSGMFGEPSCAAWLYALEHARKRHSSPARSSVLKVATVKACSAIGRPCSASSLLR